MVAHLKIFDVEHVGDTLVVMPGGDGSAFRYQELQVEVNSIRGQFGRGKAKNLVIDLSKMDYFGSEFIGALVSMARETRATRGKAAMCSASENMLEVLQNMSLFNLWPHVANRDEALEAVGETSPR